jgi:hypothetical protein
VWSTKLNLEKNELFKKYTGRNLTESSTKAQRKLIGTSWKAHGKLMKSI